MKEERREVPRMYVAWPITVVTDKGVIEGHSVNITPLGVFLRSKSALKENETYEMIISLPNDKKVVIKGRLVWSNLNGEERSEPYSSMGFSFVKVDAEDQKLLKGLISMYAPGDGGEGEA